MQTENVAWFPCQPEEAFKLASRVDLWPQLLPHYRWVRFHRGGPENGGLVEMAARRQFGALGWPVWWCSRMAISPAEQRIRYTHVDGLTKGMEVLWQMEASRGGTQVSITHWWAGGPSFCGPAATYVGRSLIGPVFVHFIADQTLRHLAQHAGEGIAV